MASKATLKKIQNMFDGSLPITNAKVLTGIIKTKLDNGTNDIKYIHSIIPVEVLSVSFNTCNMRVRYVANIWSDEPKIETVDIDASDFLSKLTIKD